MSSGPKKHVGQIVSTGKRCIVAFMQIPEREDHALVISVESLPPRYEQAVIDLVNSPEGQSEQVFANLLGRRTLPDTGEQVLTALYNMGQLHAEPIDNIVMLPLPSQPIPLRQVINLIGGSVPDQRQTPVPPEAELEKFNPYGASQIQQLEASEANRGTALNLLDQAALLEGEARRKREEAYRFAPDLRPTVAAPDVGEVAKAVVKNSRRKNAG